MDNRGFGMKWHNFLIYFSLWLNALVCLFIGATGVWVCFSADPPGRYVGNMEAKFDAAAVGVALILMAVYTVITRYKLAKRKDGARKHLVTVWLLSGFASSLFMVIDGSGSFLGLIPTVIMAVVNHYYYQKRDDLFIC